jgi:hypothetical protein
MYAIVNDVTPSRATVVSLAEDGTGILQAWHERGDEHARIAIVSEETQIGDRIWTAGRLVSTAKLEGRPDRVVRTVGARARHLRIPVNDTEGGTIDAAVAKSGRPFAEWARERLLWQAHDELGIPLPDEEPNARERVRDAHARGLSNAEIADEVNLTPGTVRQYLSQLGLRAHR